MRKQSSAWWLAALLLAPMFSSASAEDDKQESGNKMESDTRTFPSQDFDAENLDVTTKSSGVSSGIPDPTPPGPIQWINPEVSDFRKPEYPGKYYDAMVPATLDPAERARMSVNALTEMVNKSRSCIPYMEVDHMFDPPKMDHTVCDLQVYGHYFAFLPLARLTCGSRQNMDVEYTFMKTMLKMQGEDGLLYSPTVGWPWVLLKSPGVGLPASDGQIEQVCTLGYGTIRALTGFLIYAQKDPRGPWAMAARRLAEGFKRSFIIEGDNAFLFDEWTEPGRPIAKMDPPLDGIKAAAGTWVAKALAQYDQKYGQTENSDLIEKISHYAVGDLNYFAEDGRFLEDMPPNGQWAHFHTHAMNLLAVLYGARTTGNRELLDKALKAYHYAIRAGDGLVGYFPENVHEDGPENWDQHPWGFITAESCEVGDMVIAALTLAKMGVDKWDDADRWIRNHFAEAQMTQTHWLTDGNLDRSMAQPMEGTFKGMYETSLSQVQNGKSTTDRVAERSVGSYACWATANDFVGRPEGLVTVANCCSPNGARTWFYVWRDMLSYDNRKLRVNLLFNRASKWADIDSHIPYSGRVDVRTKQKLDLEVRIPQWVRPEDVKCQVDGEDRELSFEGRYAIVGAVRKNRTVTLTFPIFERTDKVNIQGVEYTLVRRGNDVVSISPKGKYYPFYQRSHYRTGETLYQQVTRFVSREEFDWL